MAVVKINTNDPPPIYKSTSIDMNDDGTYRIKHTFVNTNGKNITVEYKRVQLVIDNSISLTPKRIYNDDVFPSFATINVLTDIENPITMCVEE